MTSSRIERTSIWKNTLAHREFDEFKNEREILRNAFWQLRKNTSFLVTQIARTLPELTQHDISHLDALWETGSIIIGDEFDLTPLEGFVLGAAFLLHDSALSFEAFENGKTGLRTTIQWKDAFADIKESNPNLSNEELEHQADFATLRNLHAYQAEKLLHIKWKDNSTGSEMFLLENHELRNHLGKLIGQIASSHHWDIETVVSTFNAQLNVPTGYPREWRIDAVKLACILRCADAIHIDNERAPDFLHALLKRNGVSFDHWIAQNRLAKVDIDQADPNKETILFTSTIDFKETDSNAWYTAYDAICLADREIKSCNLILGNRGGKLFKVKNIKGIGSPESMSSYIKSDGWEPRSAKVHVGNIEKVISNLGGEMLYGAGSDNLGIILREMIQNARDALKARGALDNNFEGKITINLSKDVTSTWITIEDNGIGMSERILTGPLLDFGTSFWTSSLVQSEFPGLRSSKFKSIGKFGIGFYSVFMLAEQVFVSSRNYTAGLSDIRQLKFNNGFSLRPILSKGTPSNFNSSLSTQVKLKLKPNMVSDDLLVEIKTNRMGSINFKVPFGDYLSSICAGLDVPVFYKELDKNEIKVHESITSANFDILKWLTKISFAEFQPDSASTKEYIVNNIARIKPIIENGNILGIAAINTKIDRTQQDFLRIETVGGLAYDVHSREANRYIGYLDYTPKSAKREMDHYTASPETMQEWGKQQLNELMKLNLSPFEKYIASSSLCHFKIDPSNLAVIPIICNGQMKFLSFEDLAELSTRVCIAFLNSSLGDGGHMEMHHSISELEGYALIRPLALGSFLSLKIDNGIPENNLSILDCLYRAILKKGYNPALGELVSVGINSFNQNISAITLAAIK
ncbi:ATP-binding protein [Arcicella sp. DC2W]|uniref:ATP-binding protein n=1 Tax=Arcicella gelida TaxID=2984195 RepID=A0ABU5SAS9_9BACT|nr:ATP-binding protein [Arcicella sp. DC2W]MEA5405476.1 ATP-binding protein [Arcicella sp. DC2W]